VPEVNQEWVDHLKRRPEWEAVINLFFNERNELQDAMLANQPVEKLVALSTKASVVDRYLTWALEKPGDGED